MEGRKAVAEVIRDNVLEIKSLYALDIWFENHLHLYMARNIPLYQISEQSIKQVSSLTTPDQVIIECRIPSGDIAEPLSGWILYLDGIADPGNLGTIIRTADWFGIEHVFMAHGTVDCFNPKCVQATMGSIGRIALNYLEFPKLRHLAKDHPIILAAAGGLPVKDLVIERPAIIVIGSESHGITQSILLTAHARLISIPKANHSKADSLNAAIATAALLSVLTSK